MSLEARAQADGVDLPLPDGWAVQRAPRTLLTVAAPAPASGFRPNIIVTAVRSEELIPDAAVAAIESIFERHPGALVISDDVWPHNGVAGRVIVFTYPAGETEVVVQHYVWVTERRVITMSASCATYQYVKLDALFGAVASGARFTEALA